MREAQDRLYGRRFGIFQHFLFGGRFGYTDELLSLYETAVCRGNPHALITMNNGCKDHLYKYYRGESFTSGEYNDFTEIPESRFIDGSQSHILVPLGEIEAGTTDPCQTEALAGLGQVLKNYTGGAS